MSGFGSTSEVIGRLSGRLDFLLKRNDYFTQNLANVDTPNYKARDIAFEGFLEDKGANATVDNSGTFFTPEITQFESPGMAKPNGNTVSSEKQTVAMGDNTVEFVTATEILKKHLAFLKYAAQESR